jgi:GNAT superfamily N-acetyltransferase
VNSLLAAAWRASLRPPKAWFSLPIGNGEVAGVLAFQIIPLFHIAGDLGRITALVVSSRFGRRGIGRQLVAAAERFGWERGCARIEITSGDHRPGAHAFYEAIGYGVDTRRFVKSRP